MKSLLPLYLFLNLYCLFTFALQSLLSLYFYSGISTFALLFHLNLYFLFIYFSIEISASSLLFHWNLYCLFNFLFTSLLALYFSIEIPTFSLLFDWNIFAFPLLFYWNPCFLFAFLLKLKSLLSLYFWDLYPHVGLHEHCIVKSNHALHLMCACTTSAPALHCEKQSCLASPMSLRTQKFQRKAMPSLPRSAAPAPGRNRTRPTHSVSQPHGTSFRDPVHSDLLWKRRTLSHACHTNCNLWAEPPHDWAIQLWATSWLLYHLTELQVFNCELPLDYSTTWLSYPIVRNYGSF